MKLNKMAFYISCRNLYETRHSILEEEFVMQIKNKDREKIKIVL